MTADRQPPNLLLDAYSRFDAASDSAAIAISANSSFQPGASPSPPAGRLESNVSRRCATALSARLAPSKRSALSSIVLIVGLILLL
ncbi:MAG TPA: hypothetical protein PLV92_24995, partial [Pirellulaceae bacterium]|nr:hypothetical protein [Pirellulaceae bacterium]